VSWSERAEREERGEGSGGWQGRSQTAREKERAACGHTHTATGARKERHRKPEDVGVNPGEVSEDAVLALHLPDVVGMHRLQAQRGTASPARQSRDGHRDMRKFSQGNDLLVIVHCSSIHEDCARAIAL